MMTVFREHLIVEKLSLLVTPVLFFSKLYMHRIVN